MIKAAILGGDNSVSATLIDLLSDHPDVELVAVRNSALAGKSLADYHRRLLGDTDLRFTDEIPLDSVNMLFLASAAEDARRYMEKHAEDIRPDMCIVDLTGAHLDASTPENTMEDSDLPLVDQHFIYGLPELNRKAMVRGGRRVAVPGALASALALSLLPLAKNLMLNGPIHAAAVYPQAQGVVEEPRSFTADRPLRHPDAEQVEQLIKHLQSQSRATVELMPFRAANRNGVMTILYTDLNVDLAQIYSLYTDFYKDHRFTYISDGPVSTADVEGTNKCLIHLQKVDGRLVVTAVLDARLKGAAGTAVHAMNLLFGLHERTGL
ncbi:MAG: N-acetyl-gamma-glutamyl-phosphate reductase [Muribaculaceae bacterium]|nr:N-acetyl-gamma-glutamyl-phosphate reductase [Muribaculaceae bacterium]